MKKDNLTPSNIVRRAKKPTPSFWKKMQVVGAAVGVVSAAILAAPITLPALATTIITILGTVGGTAAALGQITVKDKTIEADGEPK